MMKHSNQILNSLVLFGLMLITVNVSAQTTSTTITSAGTISEFGPETMMIRSETSAEPVRYSYTKTTTYVDETGAPVSIQTVKSGLPVTVHYVKDGDNMVASKVIVRRAVAVPAAPITTEETKTTTTTTEAGD